MSIHIHFHDQPSIKSYIQQNWPKQKDQPGKWRPGYPGIVRENRDDSYASILAQVQSLTPGGELTVGKVQIRRDAQGLYWTQQTAGGGTQFSRSAEQAARKAVSLQ